MRFSLGSVFVAIILGALLSSIADAAIIQIGNYRLGEPGSVAASSPFAPLVDSIGPANNITAYQGSSTLSIVSTGLAAPGSTAALQKSSAQVGTGWHDGSGYGLSDNWAVDLWVRPGSNAGTVGFATDNSANGLSLWYQFSGAGQDIVVGQGFNTTINELIDGPAYTVNEWDRVTLIARNGTVHFYVDEALQNSAAVPNRLLNNIMLGFGPGGNLGGAYAFDEMKVYSFAGTDSLSMIESVIFNTPEPTAVALWLLGGCVGLTWVAVRRRRR